ncbi:Homeobox-leucine zipper protein [Musa troglodytarum]|uniref:Homeobox-leucine zipper protein n=1 Tax=Musa troglodytarum TaxID=320322 RepID=A0A9E7F4G3_9LILI|nr:Homeobox-leucine zipper protein [Musa troglodytarum]
MAMIVSGKEAGKGQQQAAAMETGKYVRYTPEQVDALERVYNECPKPSSLKRQQLIRECPILSNIEPKQIKVWFQNRRCREKQRKEASRLQTVNRKLTAMNKLLMEENDRLQKQVSHLVYENGYMRQQLHNPSVATTDTSCESVVTSGQHHHQQNPTPQHPQRDANPAGLLAIAEETLAEFLSKATGTAVDWVQMVGMKPGPDSIGIIAVSHNCSGVAARACGLVSLEPTKTYAPTTLAVARDFWTLRYTTALEDGSLVALRHLTQIAQEISGEVPYGGGRQPAVLRAFSQRLSRGFNDAVNGFSDDGWSLLGSDGVEDVTIAINSSPNKLLGSHANPSALYSTLGGGILCSKASMLLQNVPPAILVRFLREHRSEWADCGVDAYSAASLRANPYAVPGVRASTGFLGSQVILPLAHTAEHEELCSGVDENAVGACAQLVFAPIDESFDDDLPLLPSGFRDSPATTRTLDLASMLETGSGATARSVNETASSTYNVRSVLTIAFQFTYENHLRDNVAAMARQYVRSVVASVQTVAMAIAPSRPGCQIGVKQPPGSPEAHTLAQWISRSYRTHTGVELFQASPVFTFSNQAGLDMLETTLIALQDHTLEKILDDSGRKVLCSEFPKIMQQGFSYLPSGICLSSMGRPVSYEQAVTWKVLNEEDSPHCLAFIRMQIDMPLIH